MSTGGIPGCDVTLDNAKAAEAIWGQSLLKMKGNTVRKNATRMTQSIVRVPTKLIKLHQNVELAIDVFFINKHIFFITFSTKICFTTITHLTSHNKKMIWEALHFTYKMYLLRGFRIIVIKGDQEFASISSQVVTLPTTPSVDWESAVQHYGFIKRNIRFVKEKVRSLRHSLPFVHVPAIMVIQMVLNIVKFVNGFPQQGGLKYYLPGQIMTGCSIHADNLLLKFGTYCQVSKNVEPRNSLAERTRGAISIGNSGNLMGGQAFMALDTETKMTRFQWTELPMPKTVIDRVNQIGKDEPSILTFTNRHGHEIGDTTQDFDPGEDIDEITGVDKEITGVEQINEVPTETGDLKNSLTPICLLAGIKNYRSVEFLRRNSTFFSFFLKQHNTTPTTTTMVSRLPLLQNGLGGYTQSNTWETRLRVSTRALLLGFV